MVATISVALSSRLLSSVCVSAAFFSLGIFRSCRSRNREVPVVRTAHEAIVSPSTPITSPLPPSPRLIVSPRLLSPCKIRIFKLMDCSISLVPTRTTDRALAAYKNASGFVRLGLMMMVLASSATGVADSGPSGSWATQDCSTPGKHRPVHAMHKNMRNQVDENDFIAANMMRTC